MTTKTATATTKAASSTVVGSIVGDIVKKTASKDSSYTPEVTAQLVKAYETNKNVDELAAQFGRKPASIRAKLSHEGVYIKKEKATKSGLPIESKEDQINDLAVLLNCKPDELDSMSKVTKLVLSKIINALQVQSDLLDTSDI